VCALLQLDAVRDAVERASHDAKPAKMGGGRSFLWEEGSARGDRITWLKTTPSDPSTDASTRSDPSTDASTPSDPSTDAPTPSGPSTDTSTLSDPSQDIAEPSDHSAGLPLLIRRLLKVRSTLLTRGADVAGPYSLQLAVYPGGGARYVRHRDASASW
jgi:hypothetical protein